ncbi:MAG: hypothetical protein IKC13_00135 [Elusimicrobiaceae bacterium]|nr:hypothetical protein [Elusimicrobiaceae bacterium]
MTLAQEIPYVIYEGNAECRRWDIPFSYLNKNDLHVSLLDENGAESSIGADYEIDDELHVLFYPQPDSDRPPLSVGQKLLIVRQTPTAQQTAFLAQQSFDPALLEQGYDKAMLIAQELALQLKQAVKYPLGACAQTDAQSYLTQITQAQAQACQGAAQANAAAQRAAQAVQESALSATAAAQSQASAAQSQKSAAVSAEQTAAAVAPLQTALTQKADLDLSNVSANLDYVVESYRNGTSWYRVYKSGWVEQGGRVSSSSEQTIKVTLLKPMSDNKYCVQRTNASVSGVAATYKVSSVSGLSTTSFNVYITDTLSPTIWYVCGQGA